MDLVPLGCYHAAPFLAKLLLVKMEQVAFGRKKQRLLIIK